MFLAITLGQRTDFDTFWIILLDWRHKIFWFVQLNFESVNDYIFLNSSSGS